MFEIVCSIYFNRIILPGQKSRVAFAVLCAKEPNFLVLDEPTNHLDMETIEALGAGSFNICFFVVFSQKIISQ